MKVSLSWLQTYVSIEMDPARLADALTMTGLEVEAISDRYEYLEHGYVGRIVDISPHPNVDTLSCCEVDLGSQKISVVCGAPNIEKNMLVPVALPGTLLPFGTPVEKNVIRGIASDGMLCSEAELGLGSDQSGIMVLNPSVSVGEKLTQALKLSDIVFEIGYAVTP